MTIQFRIFFSALLLLLLAACSQQAPKQQSAQALPKGQREALWEQHQKQISQLNHWQAQGRLAAAKASKGGNAQFVWQQKGDNYQLKLFGPFGSGSVIISGSPNDVVLKEANGKVTRAKSPELLMQKVAGWQVPISGLIYWLRGIPVPQSSSPAKQLNESGYLSYLQQDGWKIEYENYQESKALPLPSKLRLQNGQTKLKMVITSWKQLQ